MASVVEQIITDKIQGVPGGSGATEIARASGNMGFAVNNVSPQTTAGSNDEAFAAVEIELTNETTDVISGVLGDYHHEKLCSIFRKGRVFVASTVSFSNTHIGQGIAPTTTAGKVNASSTGIGEILGGGTHSVLGNYFIVDLNLP